MWQVCNGKIWDYEKVFYQVRLFDGTLHWVWSNAGRLTDMETSDTLPVEQVAEYREADDDYFGWLEDQ